MTRLNEMLAKHLAAEEDPLQIDADDPIEFLFCNLEKGRGRVDAGTIDDDVDTAGALQYGVQQRLNLRFTRRFGGVKPPASGRRLDPRAARLAPCVPAANAVHLVARP